MQSIKSYLKNIYFGNSTLASTQLCVGMLWFSWYSDRSYFSLFLALVLPLLSCLLSDFGLLKIYYYFFPHSRYITKWVRYVDNNGKEQILVSLNDNPEWFGWKKNREFMQDKFGQYLVNSSDENIREYIKSTYSTEGNRNGVKPDTEIKVGILMENNKYYFRLFNNWNPLRLFSNIECISEHYVGNRIVQISTNDFLRLKDIRRYRFYDLNEITWRCAALRYRETLARMRNEDKNETDKKED